MAAHRFAVSGCK